LTWRIFSPGNSFQRKQKGGPLYGQKMTGGRIEARGSGKGGGLN